MTTPPYLQQQLDHLDEKIKEAQASLADPDLKQLAQEEIANLEAQKKALLASFSPTADSEGNAGASLDFRPAIIEIRAAAGGDEAKIWADDLTRMYTRFCDIAGFTYQLIDDGIIKKKSGNSWHNKPG